MDTTSEKQVTTAGLGKSFGLDIYKIREDFPMLQYKYKGKMLIYFDSAATNTWEVEVAFDPNDDMQTINVGRLSRITFASGKIVLPGETSMVALKLNCRTAGAASLSMLAVHYEGEEAPG